MSAAIIPFPGGASRDAFAVPPPPIAPTGLATKFADHFLPVVQASVDLLSANEADFEARCRRMLDSDGTGEAKRSSGNVRRHPARSTVWHRAMYLPRTYERPYRRPTVAIKRNRDGRLPWARNGLSAL